MQKTAAKSGNQDHANLAGFLRGLAGQADHVYREFCLATKGVKLPELDRQGESVGQELANLSFSAPALVDHPLNVDKSGSCDID